MTEPDPALVEWRKTNPQHPVLRDADAKWYVREERGGWILGPYERGAPARFLYDVPESFRADLFPLDLERIEAEREKLFHGTPTAANDDADPMEILGKQATLTRLRSLRGTV